MANVSDATKRYLVASDFDQTLSFNDSGRVLSELVGNVWLTLVVELGHRKRLEAFSLMS